MQISFLGILWVTGSNKKARARLGSSADARAEGGGGGGLLVTAMDACQGQTCTEVEKESTEMVSCLGVLSNITDLPT